VATWTLFFRAESNRHDPRERPAKYAIVTASTTSCACDVLAMAIANHDVPKGSHRTGVFEMQNDLGIYSRDDLMRIDFSTPRRAAKVNFKTWEEMEREERAAAYDLQYSSEEQL
jgi:hypothetical protein